MAKLRNKQNNGSLIFTWVVTILLVLFTLLIVKDHFDAKEEYRLSHSELFANQDFATALSDTLGIPAGNLTESDLDAVKSINLTSMLDSQSNSTLAMITYYLEGYDEAYEAYNKEGITEEEKKNLVDPATLYGGTMFEGMEILDDVKLFKNLKGFDAYNYSEESDVDLLKFAAENFASLEELTVYGYKTSDFSVVKNLTGLTTLAVVDSSVNDISAVKDLTKLEVLALNGAELTDISAISGLTNLKNLSISGTSVSDISVISGLTNLEQLDLSANKITDISALSTLNNDKLTVLYMEGNEITDWSPIAHIDADKVIKDEEVVEETAPASEETE